MPTLRTTVGKREPAIALLSDHALFRAGVVGLLHRSGYHRVAEFDRGRRLLDAVSAHPPSVVIVDLDHERDDTMTVVRRIRRELPDAQLVLIGTPVRQAAAESNGTPAVDTPSGTGVDLVATIAGDARPRSLEVIRELRQWGELTPRQRDVMRWLTVGLDNHAIARKLRIGDRAVKAHVTRMLDTFHLTSRTQLALLAQRAGLRPPG